MIGLKILLGGIVTIISSNNLVLIMRDHFLIIQKNRSVMRYVTEGHHFNLENLIDKNIFLS